LRARVCVGECVYLCVCVCEYVVVVSVVVVVVVSKAQSSLHREVEHRSER